MDPLVPARTWFSGRLPARRSQAGLAIYEGEISGPGAVGRAQRHFENAVKLVKDHDYGNGFVIFTRDGVHRPHPDRHSRRERADPGADRLSQLWRLEAFTVWRHGGARPRGRALLHAPQDDDRTLAPRHPRRRRIRHADGAVAVPARGISRK